MRNCIGATKKHRSWIGAALKAGRDWLAARLRVGPLPRVWRHLCVEGSCIPRINEVGSSDPPHDRWQRMRSARSLVIDAVLARFLLPGRPAAHGPRDSAAGAMAESVAASDPQTGKLTFVTSQQAGTFIRPDRPASASAPTGGLFTPPTKPRMRWRLTSCLTLAQGVDIEEYEHSECLLRGLLCDDLRLQRLRRGRRRSRIRSESHGS
jgi:hypothetical protein